MSRDNTKKRERQFKSELFMSKSFYKPKLLLQNHCTTHAFKLLQKVDPYLQTSKCG